jgi:hypothetical protein
MMSRPQPPRRAKLRHLLEQVVVHVEEERQLRPRSVGLEARGERRLDVGDAVGEVKAISCAASQPASRMW